MQRFRSLFGLLWLWLVLFVGPVWADYINNGNGTVTDTVTGLMWQQKTPDNTMTWAQALSYCENLSFAGYTDWRLPTRKELRSLVDYTRYNPSINTIFFPDTVASFYWSSTTNAFNKGYVLSVNFYYGYDILYFYTGKSTSNYVRAVRGGQSGSLGDLVISPVSRAVGSGTGTTTFSVSNTGNKTMPWTAAVTTGGSWLSITSGDSGTNSGTIDCNFMANDTTSTRTGTIRVTADGAAGSPVDVTVSQAAHQELLTISAFAESGGSISPSGYISVPYGSDQTFTITPDSGYKIASVLVDLSPVTVSADGTYTIPNVTSNRAITAKFSPMQFTITATAETGGTISPSGYISVPYGSDQTFTIKPDIGHQVASVLVDESFVSIPLTGGIHTFRNVTEDHNISVNFTKGISPKTFSGKIYQDPLVVIPGKNFIQKGEGFSPNNTVTLHFFDKSFQETTESLTTDENGKFTRNGEYSDLQALGKYSWWAVDDATGLISNSIIYSISMDIQYDIKQLTANSTIISDIDTPPPSTELFGVLYPKGKFDSNKDTFIIVHGFNLAATASDDDISQIPSWVTLMGDDIIGDNSWATGSNVFIWDWQKEALPKLITNNPDCADVSIIPYDMTEPSGKSLAIALAETLPSGYSQNVHFIGHSLGTLVSIYASKYATMNHFGYASNINHLVFLESPCWFGTPGDTFLFDHKDALFIDSYRSSLYAGFDYGVSDVVNIR